MLGRHRSQSAQEFSFTFATHNHSQALAAGTDHRAISGVFSCPSKPKCNFDSGYFSLLAADLNGDGKSTVIAP